MKYLLGLVGFGLYRCTAKEVPLNHGQMKGKSPKKVWGPRFVGNISVMGTIIGQRKPNMVTWDNKLGTCNGLNNQEVQQECGGWEWMNEVICRMEEA